MCYLNLGISVILHHPWVMYRTYKAVFSFLIFFYPCRYHKAAKTWRSEWQRWACCSWFCLTGLSKQFRFSKQGSHFRYPALNLGVGWFDFPKFQVVLGRYLQWPLLWEVQLLNEMVLAVLIACAQVFSHLFAYLRTNQMRFVLNFQWQFSLWNKERNFNRRWRNILF